MIAFEYTAGWGVLLTAVVALLGTTGTLLGVLLTQRSGRRSEAERRDHERALRELELREAHIGRLHDGRQQAYREFLRRALDRRRVDVDHASRVSRVGHLLSQDTPDHAAIAQARRDAEAGLDAARAVAQSVEQALVDVELVASRGVRRRARRLLRGLEAARQAGMDVAASDESTFFEAWDRQMEVHQSLEEFETKLRDAISEELGLDR